MSPKHTALILRSCFYLALVFLTFSAGVVSAHLDLPIDGYYRNVTAAAMAQIDRWKSIVLAVRRDAIYPGETTVNEPASYRGYTLYTTNQSSRVFLIDMDGKPVHQWHLPFENIWPNPTHIENPVPVKNIYVDNAYMYPNGDVLAIYYAAGDTPYGYGLAKLDKDSKLVWKLDKRTHHDVYVADSGTIYVLSENIRKEPIAQLKHLNYPVLEDHIEIVSPEGKSLDTISIAAAFSGTAYEQFLYGDNLVDEKGDITHANSVMMLEPRIASQFPQFKAGQILVSMRTPDLLAVIDPASKKVVWAAKGPWVGQHQARFLDNGHIMLFDNAGFNNGQYNYSRVLEVDPKTFGIAWSYTPDDGELFYSSARGSVQKLPNGNVLITVSGASYMFEVTPDKKTVWKYTLPWFANSIVLESAKRITYDQAAFLKQ